MSPVYLIVYLWWSGTSVGSSAVTIPMPSMEACRHAQASVATAAHANESRARAWTHCLPAVTP